MRTVKQRIARRAGLDEGQMRTFEELTDEERDQVEWRWGVYRAEKYLYGVRQDGRLVSRRWLLPEKGNKDGR